VNIQNKNNSCDKVRANRTCKSYGEKKYVQKFGGETIQKVLLRKTNKEMEG